MCCGPGKKAKLFSTTRHSMPKAAVKSAMRVFSWRGNVRCGARFTVRDTQKIGASFAHVGVLESGELRVGDAVDAQVDQERRTAIALNHSATHLLHAALEKSAGDACGAKRIPGGRRSVALRFFAHPGAVSRRNYARSRIW